MRRLLVVVVFLPLFSTAPLAPLSVSVPTQPTGLNATSSRSETAPAPTPDALQPAQDIANSIKQVVTSINAGVEGQASSVNRTVSESQKSVAANAKNATDTATEVSNSSKTGYKGATDNAKKTNDEAQASREEAKKLPDQMGLSLMPPLAISPSQPGTSMSIQLSGVSNS
eukprot:c5853_g2_i1.p1 GENE.c5853_g2_i1~~c5853_g2_i1.p1  ORF type:complete len:170 (-),score=39.29 c5853_g2_i1:125-634(-)